MKRKPFATKIKTQFYGAYFFDDKLKQESSWIPGTRRPEGATIRCALKLPSRRRTSFVNLIVPAVVCDRYASKMNMDRLVVRDEIMERYWR